MLACCLASPPPRWGSVMTSTRCLSDPRSHVTPCLMTVLWWSVQLHPTGFAMNDYGPGEKGREPSPPGPTDATRGDGGGPAGVCRLQLQMCAYNCSLWASTESWQISHWNAGSLNPLLAQAFLRVSLARGGLMLKAQNSDLGATSQVDGSPGQMPSLALNCALY